LPQTRSWTSAWQDLAGGGDGGQFGGDLAGLGLVAGGDAHGLRVA
jgi:hypothetical protein